MKGLKKIIVSILILMIMTASTSCSSDIPIFETKIDENYNEFKEINPINEEILLIDISNSSILEIDTMENYDDIKHSDLEQQIELISNEESDDNVSWKYDIKNHLGDKAINLELSRDIGSNHINLTFKFNDKELYSNNYIEEDMPYLLSDPRLYVEWLDEDIVICMLQDLKNSFSFNTVNGTKEKLMPENKEIDYDSSMLIDYDKDKDAIIFLQEGVDDNTMYVYLKNDKELHIVLKTIPKNIYPYEIGRYWSEDDLFIYVSNNLYKIDFSLKESLNIMKLNEEFKYLNNNNNLLYFEKDAITYIFDLIKNEFVYSFDGKFISAYNKYVIIENYDSIDFLDTADMTTKRVKKGGIVTEGIIENIFVNEDTNTIWFVVRLENGKTKPIRMNINLP